MKRLWIAGALLMVLASVLYWGSTGCSITVRCPGGPAATTYYYLLVSDSTSIPVHICYDPELSGSDAVVVRNVSPGTYRLLEDGVQRCVFTLAPGTRTLRIDPARDWPIMPPSGKE